MAVEQKKANVHKGHRKRMAEKFLQNGLRAFSDHEVLEMLLYFTISRKDTNEIGHQLIRRFGSLYEVFEAPYEQLLEVEGVGSQSALLIKMVYAMFGRYQENRTQVSWNSEKLINRQRVGEYFVPQFAGEREEVLLVAYLDDSGRVLKCVECGRGSHNQVGANPYQIARGAIVCGSHTVVLAHNHPNGVAEPSQQDIDITRRLKNHLEELDIQLYDHCIVAGGRYVSVFSYMQTSLLTPRRRRI
jgi:DNA repair protein RadC